MSGYPPFDPQFSSYDFSHVAYVQPYSLVGLEAAYVDPATSFSVVDDLHSNTDHGFTVVGGHEFGSTVATQSLHGHLASLNQAWDSSVGASGRCEVGVGPARPPTLGMDRSVNYAHVDPVSSQLPILLEMESDVFEMDIPSIGYGPLLMVPQNSATMNMVDVTGMNPPRPVDFSQFSKAGMQGSLVLDGNNEAPSYQEAKKASAPRLGVPALVRDSKQSSGSGTPAYTAEYREKMMRLQERMWAVQVELGITSLSPAGSGSLGAGNVAVDQEGSVSTPQPAAPLTTTTSLEPDSNEISSPRAEEDTAADAATPSVEPELKRHKNWKINMLPRGRYVEINKRNEETVPLLRLPPEILNMVMQFVVGNKHIQVYKRWKYNVIDNDTETQVLKNNRKTMFDIFLVCRHLYHNYSALPFHINTFEFYHLRNAELGFRDFGKGRKWQFDTIANISIHLRGSQGRYDDDSADFPLEHFKGLKQLTIILDDDFVCRDQQGMLDAAMARVPGFFKMMAKVNAERSRSAAQIQQASGGNVKSKVKSKVKPQIKLVIDYSRLEEYVANEPFQRGIKPKLNYPTVPAG